ncbi:MAG TPA: SurA N-terminal domain-containing protein [Verrucomicrobiae bacterium]|jgi:hypothetical protein
MIGTIRKHSSWLWIIIAGATIVTFVWWGASVPTRGGGGGGGGGGDFGSIYGKDITQDEYSAAKNDYFIFSWLHNGFQWPDQDPNLSNFQIDQQIYLRIMLLRKAQMMGITADDKAAESAAGNLLSSPDLMRAFHVRGGSVPIDSFVKGVLQPKGFTADDLERFARNDLILQQLVQSIGMAGQLFTPEEAASAWRRENEDRKAQIVFFSATNYLAQVPVSEMNVGGFYTNYMSYYRLPDRVQISYVEFNVTNYLTAAEKKIGATNLDFQVSSIFAQDGMEGVPDAKTPDEAKAEIRQFVIRKEAMTEANNDANTFANAVFQQTPASPANLALLARKKELVVKTPAPFSQQYGPSEFIAPEAFTKSAFSLTSDDAFAGPVQGPYAYYVMALDKQLPSEIPPLTAIHDEVARDYQTQVALALARRAGTNFVTTLNLRLLSGRTFPAVCVAAGLDSEELPPFSLSTTEVPELKNRAGLPQIKQAAFGTLVGHASDFEQTDEGGFILYVEKQLPPDEAAMKTQMPQYLAQVRREQSFELFQDWVNGEAGRQLRSIPQLAKELQAAQAAQGAK